MYHTWFFIKRLAEELDTKLSGLQFLACFSQQKDELILSFGNKDREFHIKADLSSQAGILTFQDSFARAKRNSADLFSELLDAEVVKVSSYHHERSFFISFDNGYQLIFKMHGRRANILLAKGDEVLKVFRNNLEQDLAIIPSELAKNLQLDEPNIIWLLGKANTYLVENQLDNIVHLKNTLIDSDIHIGLKDEKPVLSLAPIDSPILTTESAVEASNKFGELHYRFFLFGQEKKTLIGTLTKKINQGESYISKTSKKLQALENQRSLEEIANIIMANLHQIQTKKDEVVLEDFYLNQPIKIKLNPNLSPQKNAENYYRKHKNKKIEFDKLRSNIAAKTNELAKLNEELERVQAIDNLRELRAFKGSFEKGLGKNEKAPLPYFEFDVNGWTVLVGKNAKSNDILTTKVAGKNDLWLHARDVSGSHVVLRQRPGTNFPSDIIERAAALAAWYSKRKTDSLCPVIHTPRKYVRKVKGAPPGQVVVDKEEVVMVEPNNQL